MGASALTVGYRDAGRFGRSAFPSFYRLFGSNSNSAELQQCNSRSNTIEHNNYSGQPQRARYDSNSLYHNQDVGQPRSSAGLLNGGTRSAGCNQNSFFDVGRTELLKGGYDEDSLKAKNDGSWDILITLDRNTVRRSSIMSLSKWICAFRHSLYLGRC